MTADPIWCLTCVGVAHDLALLPHWVRHYLGLGLDPRRILVILHAEDPADAGLDRAGRILEEHGMLATSERWIAPYTSETMWERRRTVQRRICAPNDWVVHADVDEFQRWPEPVADCLARAAEIGADCVQGVMIDRLAPGGTLAPVRAEPYVLEQFPIRAEASWSIGGSSAVHGRNGTVKMMAARGYLYPGRGGHRPLDGRPVRYLYRAPLVQFREIDDPAFRFSVPTQVDHVHWTDTLPGRLQKRLATPGVSPAGVEYGRRQLDHIARAGGAIALSQVAVEADCAVRTADWPDRLAALRKIGARKARIAPFRRIVTRLAGRRTLWLMESGRRILRTGGFAR